MSYLVRFAAPLPGVEDSTNYTYDAAGAVTEQRLPDPDGAGPLGSRATGIVRNGEGRVSKTLIGQYPTNTDGSEGSFTTAQTIESGYSFDTGLKVSDSISTITGTVQLTQYEYDNDLRLICTAYRLNRIAFEDSCEEPGGGQNSDTIELSSYGSDGRISSVEKGGKIASYTYSPNGNILTALDGNNNTNSYDYDIYDRQSGIFFADGSAEIAEYSNAGDLSRLRKRNESVIVSTYDGLGRLSGQSFSGNAAGELNPVFSYDLLNRIKSKSYVSLRPEGGTSVNFAYDALGRERWLGKFGQAAKWSFCLKAASMAAGQEIR